MSNVAIGREKVSSWEEGGKPLFGERKREVLSFLYHSTRFFSSHEACLTPVTKRRGRMKEEGLEEKRTRAEAAN